MLCKVILDSKNYVVLQNSMAIKNQPLQDVIDAAGSAAKIAEHLGIRRQAIYQWNEVPALRVIAIERFINGAVTRHEMRPDLYPEE